MCTCDSRSKLGRLFGGCARHLILPLALVYRTKSFSELSTNSGCQIKIESSMFHRGSILNLQQKNIFMVPSKLMQRHCSKLVFFKIRTVWISVRVWLVIRKKHISWLQGYKKHQKQCKKMLAFWRKCWSYDYE